MNFTLLPSSSVLIHSSSRMFVACSRKLLNDGCGLFRAAGWLMQRIYRRQLGITHSEGLRSHSLGQLWCGKNGGSALRGGSAERSETGRRIQTRRKILDK